MSGDGRQGLTAVFHDHATQRLLMRDYHRYMVSHVPHEESENTPAAPAQLQNEPVANRYTHGHEQAVLANHAQRRAADCAAYLLPRLRPGMSVLDVGFGPGSITLDLAEAVAPGSVVGIENTDAPIQAAQDTPRRVGTTAPSSSRPTSWRCLLTTIPST